ncbi:hypothetical protein [Arachidicoccus soli]|uniref:hypothetical protein n=1 Tax=Arachidicoccus soli TaxID=2341117 RepID=UPI0013C47354|nr:hypothetical protein [Arachidicoccus soli]
MESATALVLSLCCYLYAVRNLQLRTLICAFVMHGYADYKVAYKKIPMGGVSPIVGQGKTNCSGWLGKIYYFLLYVEY